MEEISISLEETNKLRAQVGLHPIPVSESNIEAIKSNLNDRSRSNGKGKNELSIEETNRLRISLGLKPIEVQSNNINNVNDYENNYNNHNSEREQRAKEKDLKQRLEAAKLTADRRRKLHFGKTLLDEYEEQTTDSWLNSLGYNNIKGTNASNEKSVPLKNLATAISRSQTAASNEELNNVMADAVFTLDDTSLYNQNDILGNPKFDSKVKHDLKEKERERQIQNGMKYTTFDDHDNRDRNENKLLVSASEVKIENEPTNKKHDDNAEGKGKKRLSINLFDEEENPNTSTQRNDDSKLNSKFKMKKLKKSKTTKENSRRVAGDDYYDDIKLEPVKLESVQNDLEDDLEKTLSMQRKLKQQKRRKITPEEMLNEMRQYSRIEEEEKLENDAMKGTSVNDLTFDPTTDFLLSLPVGSEVKQQPKEEKNYSDLTNNDAEDVKQNPEIQKETEHQVETEPQPESDFGSGIALTLKFLKSNNVIESSNINRAQQESMKQAELMRLKISIEERILRGTLSRDPEYNKLSKSDQDQTFNAKLDEILIEKKIVGNNSNPIIEGYRPNVQIVHRDNTGKELDTKEAFKYLSLNFHGTKKNKKSSKLKHKNKKSP